MGVFVKQNFYKIFFVLFLLISICLFKTNPVFAQICSGSTTGTYTSFSCGYDPARGAFCQGITKSINAPCGGPYCLSDVREPSGKCSSDGVTCDISDINFASGQGCFITTPPTSIGRPPPGGNTCTGSCFAPKGNGDCGSYGLGSASGSCTGGQICCGGVSAGGGSCGLGGCGAYFDEIRPNALATDPSQTDPCQGYSGYACDSRDYNSVMTMFVYMDNNPSPVDNFPTNSVCLSCNLGPGATKCLDADNYGAGKYPHFFFNKQIPDKYKDGLTHTMTSQFYDPATGSLEPTAIYTSPWQGGGSSTFKCAPAIKSWWQVIGGDALTNGDLISSVAPAPPNPAPYFILGSPSVGYPGVAIYGAQHDFLLGVATDPPSITKWGANTKYNGKVYDSNYFNALVPSDIAFTDISGSVNGGTFASSGAPSHGHIWFKAKGDLTINSNINISNRKVILLVSGGDLNIQGRINLTKGQGFFLAIVGKDGNGNKGNIIIDPKVDSKGSSGAALEGLFLADNQIRTGISSNQLYVRGSLAALGGVILQRDIGTTNSATTPSELIEYAPDLLFSYPRDLIKSPVSWHEVAP